jgi:hypothetical protein
LPQGTALTYGLREKKKQEECREIEKEERCLAIGGCPHLWAWREEETRRM